MAYSSDTAVGTVVADIPSVRENLLVFNGEPSNSASVKSSFFLNSDFGFIDKLLSEKVRTNNRQRRLYRTHVTILPSVTSIGDGAVIAAAV
jgi:hypothetical protein